MFYQTEQLARINRLEQKIHHAQMHRRNRILHIGITGNNDDRHRRPYRFAYLPYQFKPTDVAHAQIGDDQPDRRLFFKHLQRCLTTGCSHATNAIQRKNLRQQLTSILVVVNDQYTLRRQIRFEHDCTERFPLGIAQNIVVGHGVL